MKKLFSFAILSTVIFAGQANAQLYISSGSTFFIQPGGVVTVQGDVTGLTDVQGGGKVLLKGSANQNVNMNGFTIPNLEMDNVANATLTGNTRVGSSLLFTNGKILAGNFNFNLADVATVSGGGTSKFIETAGTGQVIKELTTANNASGTYELPVGAGSIYRPAYLTTAAATFSSGNVGVRVLAVADPNRPPSVSDYINAYWPVTKTGVTAGTVSLEGQYVAGDVTVGSAANMRGYFYQPTDWASAGETHNAGTFRVGAPITGAAGDITGIDKFDLVSAKAFLQGPYTTGTMTDGLRTPTNSIPLSDPYRTAAYSSSFTHTANATTETIAGSVLADQTPVGNNIVDWVFLELRNNLSPGSIIQETRSALIRRDGMIVDIDGVSPVTFNNIPTGSYTLAVRHRNHLGISTDPTAFTHNFGDVKSGVSLVDFSTATDAQIYGTATAFTVVSGVNVMWSGDVNSNGTTKYSGSQNDPNVVLSQVLAFPANSSGLYTYNAAFGYFSGDVNMDRKVKYSGSQNDAILILNNVLAVPTNTSGLYTFSNLTRQLPLP